MENERFSEFSYGFALTDELIHWHGTTLTGAPIFPSLKKEGQVGGGYDVKLPGVPLFLQFKLSHRMERRNATETSQYGLYEPYFYRMLLRPRNRSKQHQLLLDLEAKGNQVFYAAPAFFETSELNNAYMDRAVVQRSVFFRPFEIGTINNDARHWIAFRNASDGYGFFFSTPVEPKKVETVSGEMLARILGEKLRAPERTLTQDTFRQISMEMTVIVEKQFGEEAEEWVRDFKRAAAELSPIQQVAYYSHTFFDSTFFVVQPKS